MTTLKEKVCAPEVRPKLIEDGVRLVDAEVAAKSGLSGMAIKAGFKVVKGIKPGLIREAVDGLMDEFVDQLEPFYQEFQDKDGSGSFGSHLSGQARKVANALLGVTDARAGKVENRTIKKTYEKLRPQGEKNVEAAVPGLGRVLDKHL